MLLRIGLTFVIVSSAPWLAIPTAPLLAGSAAEAALIATGLWAASSILFWGGVALAGRDAWATVRAHSWRALPGALWRAVRDGRVA